MSASSHSNHEVVDSADGLLDSLKEGPVFIGETHGKAAARATIVDLIERGEVNKLFVEAPVCSKELQALLINPTEDILKHPLYLDYINKYKNSFVQNADIPLENLFETAIKKGVGLYFHDAPPVWGLAGLDTGLGFETPRVKYPESDMGLTQRNIFSGKFIQHYNTEGSEKLSETPHIVILAGAHHLKEECCAGKGTLQKCCGITQSKSFDLSNQEETASLLPPKQRLGMK